MGKKFIIATDKRGRITLPKEVMEHCGIPSGGELNVEFLPDGVLGISPVPPLPPTEAPQDPIASCTNPDGASKDEKR